MNFTIKIQHYGIEIFSINSKLLHLLKKKTLKFRNVSIISIFLNYRNPISVLTTPRFTEI